MKDALGHGSSGHGLLATLGLHSHAIGSLPSLQRRHFTAIAAELKAEGVGKNSDDHAERVANFASQLSTTNPEFNRAKFIRAATP